MSAHLILGGARSGKSRYAQAFAEAHAGEVVLIVTAEILDEEMRERVEKHRAERPAHWQVIEAPLELADAIIRASRPGTLVLVDCLTLWLSNILCTQADTLESRLHGLSSAIMAVECQLLLVSNEVGWSIVPENKLARLFRDEQGRLNQRMASICEQVTLVAAGLPLNLKDTRK